MDLKEVKIKQIFQEYQYEIEDLYPMDIGFTKSHIVYLRNSRIIRLTFLNAIKRLLCCHEIIVKEDCIIIQYEK